MDKEAIEKISAEAEERSATPAHVVYEAVRKEGQEELRRKTSSLAWSGLAAGLSMCFSFVSEALLKAHLQEAPWVPLISKLGYSIGFLIVILGRQQLFTENTLTVILPLLLTKRLSVLRNVLRLWSVVLLANLLGALAFAWALGNTAVFEPETREVFRTIAMSAMHDSFGVILLRGVFAGWLIALLVWLLPVAEIARIWVIILLTYLIGLAHFPHIVAGSVEVFFLACTGARSWGEVLGGYLFPTLIGNTVGGVALVSALAHAQVAGDKARLRGE